MTTQEEFLSSYRKNNHTFHTAWRVQTEVLSDVPEHMKVCRWYPELSHLIKAVRRVSIQSDVYLPAYPDNTLTENSPVNTYIEIETDHAIACIVDFATGAEVGGVIVKSGFTLAKRRAMTLGTWRKYRAKRGHGMAWLRAKFGRGLCKSPESGSDVCPAEAYATLAGKKWG